MSAAFNDKLKIQRNVYGFTNAREPKTFYIFYLFGPIWRVLGFFQSIQSKSLK